MLKIIRKIFKTMKNFHKTSLSCTKLFTFSSVRNIMEKDCTLRIYGKNKCLLIERASNC